MAQPTLDELAEMSLEELDALDPVGMSIGMQRAVWYFRAQLSRGHGGESLQRASSYLTPDERQARRAQWQQMPAERKRRLKTAIAWYDLRKFRDHYEPLGLTEFQTLYDLVAEHEQQMTQLKAARQESEQAAELPEPPAEAIKE